MNQNQSQPSPRPTGSEPSGTVSGVHLVRLSGRTRIVLTGADRAKFLHGLCTNDIKRLKPGQGCEAFFCNVQGKILGHACIFASDEGLIIDASPGQAGLLQHLDRYLIREDVQMRDVSAASSSWLSWGPRAADVAAAVGAAWPTDCCGHAACAIADRPVLVHHVDWVAPAAMLIVAESNDAPSVESALLAAGATLATPDWLEWRRVESGTPLYGRDITIDNLPQELGRDERAISFNKGCYLGQEPIARIDALGHVNWRLVGLERPDRSQLPVGELAAADGKIVARVTSCVRAPDGSAWLALAFVRRGWQTPGTQLTGAWGEARVVSLPRTSLGD